MLLHSFTAAKCPPVPFSTTLAAIKTTVIMEVLSPSFGSGALKRLERKGIM